MRPLLVLLLASSIALAGCSSAPLASEAGQPDRPSETIKPAPDQTASGTLTLSVAPSTAPAPGVAKDCLVAGPDGEDAISKGKIVVSWTPESPMAAGDLTVNVYADVHLTATGPSPIVFEWKAREGGPSVVPLLVQASLAEGDTALAQKVDVDVTVDSFDPIHAVVLDCPF